MQLLRTYVERRERKSTSFTEERSDFVEKEWGMGQVQSSAAAIVPSNIIHGSQILVICSQCEQRQCMVAWAGASWDCLRSIGSSADYQYHNLPGSVVHGACGQRMYMQQSRFFISPVPTNSLLFASRQTTQTAFFWAARR